MPGPAKQPNRTSELHRVVAAAPDLAAATKDRYLRDLNKWIEFAGDNPRDWTTANAQLFYTQLLTTMKPQSATRLFASVQYAARWWCAELHRPDLNFTVIRMAKPRDVAKRNFIEAADAIRLLKQIDRDVFGERDFAIIVVGLETGMRRMSLSAMTVEHMTDIACKVPIKGSNGDLRSVPLSPTAIRAIARWRDVAKIRRGPVFRPLLPKIDSKGVTRVTVLDRPLSADAIYMVMRERCRRIGLHGHPHLFRHTFTSWRTQQGYLPHEIAAVTHHTVGLGALEGYIDEDALALKMRTSTPLWLQEIVEGRIP